MKGLMFSIVLALLCSGFVLRSGEDVFQATHLPGDVKIVWKLEELTSKLGESENFKPTVSRGDVILRTETKRLPLGAKERLFSISGKSRQRSLLRLTVTAAVPSGFKSYWNGYNGMRKLTFDSFDGDLSSWFPAMAAIYGNHAFAFGLNPESLYSRVDAGKSKDGRLSIAFPFVLEPGGRFDCSVVMSACDSRYGYRDIVQNWYDIFPKAYAPAEGIDPRVISGESSYMYWKPETVKGERFVGDFIRRLFGGRGTWEWCYAPFARGGDWSITDKWSAGWHGWTKESLKEKRQSVRKRLMAAEFQDIAPMWYLNISVIEWDLWKNHFPNICMYEHPRKYHCWGSENLYGVYPWKNEYGKLFLESLTRIPKEYPAVRGIGWDSCFAHREFGESVDGVSASGIKSFKKGKVFALEAVADSHLLDFNHDRKASGYRMANAVNVKLVSPYMIGVRTDTALYEGNPMSTTDRFLRIESMRARLGTGKALVWHKGALPGNFRWMDWDDYDAAEAVGVYNQLMENILFCNYYWGAVSAPNLPTIGVKYMFKAVPELIDLIRLGWQPSPAVDAPPGILLARYGKGVGARIAVINSGFEKRKVEIKFQPEYWNGDGVLVAREDGEPLDSSITPTGTTADTTLAPRSITLVRCCGAGPLKESGIANLDVKSESVRVSGRQPFWRFYLKSNDPIDWRLKLAKDDGCRRMKVRINDEKLKFVANEMPKARLVSKNWIYDYQAGARRSCLLELRSYPLFAVSRLSPQALKKADLPAKLLKQNLSIIKPAAASQKVLDEIERVKEWFRFYTNAKYEKFVEPRTKERRGDNEFSIVLSVKGEGLKGWELGKCSFSGDDTIKIVARGEKNLHKTVLAFLARLDLAYPYYGKLPEEKYFNAWGVSGKTLERRKTSEIFHPTLIEMLKKSQLIK